jgi:hypothetical protein
MDPQRQHCTRPPSNSDADFEEPGTASEPDDGTIVSDVIALAAHLKFIYGVAVGLDLALRMQCADHDVDLADCLRFGVINSTDRELERARKLIRRLRGSLPESLT